MSISTAIIGLGRIAYELEGDPLRYHPCTHAGSIRFLNGDERGRSAISIVAVCDLDAEKIAGFRAWLGEDPPGYIDYRQMLRDHRPELLIISSSHGSHYEIMCQAIQEGIPHIMLEKPATEKYDEIRTIGEAAEKNHVKVWVNYERRYHPGYRQVREEIRSGRFGEVRHVSGSVLTGRVTKKENGSPLLVDGIHWIDLLIWFFGSPVAQESCIRPSMFAEIPDTVFLDLLYDGFCARLETGGRRDYFEFIMRIDFSAGRIICGNEGLFFYESRSSGRYSGFRELMPVELQIEKRNPWVEMYGEIVDVILSPSDMGFRDSRISSPLFDSIEAIRITVEAESNPGRILR